MNRHEKRHLEEAIREAHPEAQPVVAEAAAAGVSLLQVAKVFIRHRGDIKAIIDGIRGLIAAVRGELPSSVPVPDDGD